MTIRDRDRVSLITTERNEVESIAEFLDTALNQSMQPDEIIVADGGSTDGTVEIIKDYAKNDSRIKLITAPGNRSVGRNAATKAAANEIIAVTDVGCRLDRDWLKHITEPLRRNPEAMVVSGNFKPEPKTDFEAISSAVMLQANDHIDVDTWLPSSRSIAYTKAAWRKAGGYPEHTNFNEDTPFDMALKEAGFKFEDGLKAVVYWRPRPNLREFYRQYYFYAVGDALDKIDATRILRLLIIYLTLLTLPFLAVVLPGLSALLFLTYTLWLYRRSYGGFKKVLSFKAITLMPLLLAVYDISQIAGYIYGSLNRDKLSNSSRLVR